MKCDSLKLPRLDARNCKFCKTETDYESSFGSALYFSKLQKIHRFCLTCLFKKTTKKDYVWKLSSSKIFTFLKDYLCLLEKSCVASLAETSQGLYFPSTKFKNSDLIQNIHAERLFPIFLVDSLCLNFEDKFPDLSPKMKFRFKK